MSYVELRLMECWICLYCHIQLQFISRTSRIEALKSFDLMTLLLRITEDTKDCFLCELQPLILNHIRNKNLDF